MAKITKHAKKRAKERCGFNHKTINRMADKILEQGIRHCECTGQLKRWVDGLYLENKTANNIRLYGDKAYLFHGISLITIIQIPNKLMDQARKIQKRKNTDKKEP